MRTEHILIIRFSAIGDVAMTVPVIASLAKQYPHIRITVLSRAFARPFFEGLAPNIGFMEADLKNEYRGVKGLNKLYRRLTAKHFTAIADFHGVLRSHYLRLRFHLERFKVEHINKHRMARRRLTSANNKRMELLPTPFENYAEVLEKLGYPVKIDFQSFFPENGGDLSLLPTSMSHKPTAQKWIGIAPLAAHQGKIYPAEKMEQVIQMLAVKHPESRIFLFGGGEKEREIFRQWCHSFPQCTSVPEHLAGLYKELVLMSHLNVMVSMDSANMHLASLVATPVVSVWGATHPYAGFMGWRQPADHAVQADLPCRPCSIYGNKPCLFGNYTCLKTITPELIFDKIEKILGQSQTTCN